MNRLPTGRAMNVPATKPGYKIVYDENDVRKGAAVVEAETEGVIAGATARRLASMVLEAAGLERKA